MTSRVYVLDCVSKAVNDTMNLRTLTASIFDSMLDFHGALTAALRSMTGRGTCAQVLIGRTHAKGIHFDLGSVEQREDGVLCVELSREYHVDGEMHVTEYALVFSDNRIEFYTNSTGTERCVSAERIREVLYAEDLCIAPLTVEGEVVTIPPKRSTDTVTLYTCAACGGTHTSPDHCFGRGRRGRRGRRGPRILAPEPTCTCSECGGTHRVVNSMGGERPCDYCTCAE